MRCFTVLLVKILTHKYISRWRRSSGRVVFVSRTLRIKATASTRLAEAHAMRLVAQNTSVPVPRVYSSFEYKGRTHILMQRLPGDNLCNTWTSKSDESKARILAQLADFVQEIGRIPSQWEIQLDGIELNGQTLPNSTLGGEVFQEVGLWALIDSGTSLVSLPRRPGADVAGAATGTTAVAGPKDLVNSIFQSINYNL